MGWNAHTNTKKNWTKRQLSNKKQKIAFKEASEFVKLEAGRVDGYLDMAGLNCSACAKMLEKATGRSCWGDDWQAKDIQRIQDSSNWDFI